MLENAEVRVDLTVTPGMVVTITGDPSLPSAPLWGINQNTCGQGEDEEEDGIGRALNGVCDYQSTGDIYDSMDQFFGIRHCEMGTDAADCGVFFPAAGGGFVVSDSAELVLSYIDLAGSSGLTLEYGGSLSLSSMVVPGTWLATAMAAFGGAGNVFKLSGVRVPQYIVYGTGPRYRERLRCDSGMDPVACACVSVVLRHV